MREPHESQYEQPFGQLLCERWSMFVFEGAKSAFAVSQFTALVQSEAVPMALPSGQFAVPFANSTYGAGGGGGDIEGGGGGNAVNGAVGSGSGSADCAPPTLRVPPAPTVNKPPLSMTTCATDC